MITATEMQKVKHVQASTPIYFTNEHGRFKMLNGNRQLNEGKINRIIREISEGNDMLRYYPIQVKESGDRLEILDGQHRFFICRKLNRPVFYILVKEEKSMADIAKINSNVEKWKNSDFIYCYSQQGNEHYKRLQEFVDTYNINIGTSINLLQTGHPGNDGSGSNNRHEFAHGLFTCNFLKEAIELAEHCKKFQPFEYWRDRGFIIAVHKIKEAGLVSLDELLVNCKKYPELLMKQHSPKEYIYMLEQVYNSRKQKRVVII
jgi:hypothetical protein